MTRRYSQAITICGVLVALSMVAVAGTAAADNASDYPPVDINSTVEIYDGNDSINETVELDHARGYDDEALAVFDCSIEDCSATDADGNLSAFAGSGTLEAVSKNNMTVSKNADGWEFTTNGTSPEAIIEVRNLSVSSSGITQHIEADKDYEGAAIVSGSRRSFGQANRSTINVQNGSTSDIYSEGELAKSGIDIGFDASNVTGYAIRFSGNNTFRDLDLIGRQVSGEEVSLLEDQYRVGGFVPDLTETTAQKVPENGSLTWDVNNLRDAEQTLKVQSYDGSEWQTEENLTVDATAEYDIGVEGGSEYRFVSEPNSTVDSSGGYFFGGGSPTVLNIFGVVIDRGMATGMAAVAVLLGILAFFYPGVRLFGKGSDS